MVERAMQAAEEDAGHLAIMFVGQFQCRAVEPHVRPVIIGRELPEVFDRHLLIPVGQFSLAKSRGVSLNDSLSAARNW